MLRSDLNLRVSNFIEQSEVDQIFDELQMRDEMNISVPLASGDIHDVDVEVMVPFERMVNVSILEIPTKQMQLIGDDFFSSESGDSNNEKYSRIAPFDANKTLIINKRLVYRRGAIISTEVPPKDAHSYKTRLKKIKLIVDVGKVNFTIDNVLHENLGVNEYKFERNVETDCIVVIKNIGNRNAQYTLSGTYERRWN